MTTRASEEAFGAIVAAGGFSAVGLDCGIKKGAPDLALLVAEEAVPAAAVFTTSRAAAAPVQLCRRHLEASPRCRAVVVTSGRANAGTGQAGLEAAEETARAVAAQLQCAVDDVLVCSTGVIGLPQPMDKVRSGIEAAMPLLDPTASCGHDAAMAILTTDTRTKEALQRAEGFVIGGMAKGAAMVRPDMATMLAFVTTDAVVPSDTLARALSAANACSFNAINIDGCQSTNDTVIALASGTSGVQPNEDDFTAALTAVCKDLARQIVGDAECATRIVELRVHGAADNAAAREIGKFVADSDLVRSSFYGGDPNWGRILQALGACSVPVEQEQVTIRYAGVETCRGGVAAPFDEDALVASLSQGDFVVDIGVGRGPGRAEVLTADLTPEYVSFNGERS